MDYTVTIQEEAEKITHAVFHKSVEIVEGQYGHYIYKKDEMIYIPCGGAVYVKNSITEVETCKQYLTLYFDSGDGKRRTILFPREDLVENKIVSLTAYGVQVSKKTADYLIKYIENQEVNVKHLLCHAKLGIGDFMEEHSLVNSVEQVSIGKRAMEWLLQFISKNYTQFLSKDSPKEISNCRGKLENMQTVLLNTDEESGMRLKVTDSEFMKILKEGHFSEKATVLKEWKEMGYLKAQSDRYISRVKIVGDIQVKGYIIQLPVPSNKIGGDGVKDYEEVLEERRKRINKPRQVIKDEYVEDDFFSIDDDDDLDFPEDWK